MLTIDPKEVSIGKMHGYLLGAVAPRPIAFASTVDKEGNVNLSPFSFFNCFSANPPILVFSPARRVRDNTTKHTYENVLEVPEVVINIVNYSMVEQMSLASTEYDKGVDEFIKSGLTPMRSEQIKPPRVGESPVAFECKVIEVKPLGKEGGAGNLIICEVVLAHIKDDILDENAIIDPFRLDAVARMGGNWYCRAHGDAIFEIPKPITTLGIGVDQMPEQIRNSMVLTGNNLGRLGNIEALPSGEEVAAFASDKEVDTIISGSSNVEVGLHKLAQKYLEKGDITTAWKVLLQDPAIKI
ncbi:Nitrilotriacetate monooxygenase component B [Fulvivirga imtechensis AK7]|uniref:Nitrilotriacetate monooxygenase component B n=1 Tax=Fulvivirga imtechensis AK7 TaxID=1237149 RepID=L8JN86_9BACT|nr:flavin reductase family protein [Fulvivirga imtechensis]ELR69678.1 Nitrilotriacetate monooxygenase component B [Fulvivirga imtechensis AK7]